MWAHDLIVRPNPNVLDEISQLRSFIAAIGEALGTEEKGRYLLEVARNAHNAEMELAALKRKARK